MPLIQWDPISMDQKLWQIPNTRLNLRHYLTKLKYPPQAHDPIRIKIHLFDQKACDKADFPRDQELPNWTRSNSSKTAMALFPIKDVVLGLDENRVQKVMKAMESLNWSLSPTDNFQPYTPMEFSMFERMPAVLRGKIDEDHTFDMLCNERAFLSHVHSRAHSADTPEAYLEILKIAPLQAIYKRLVVKAFMMLLATCKASANGQTPLTISQLTIFGQISNPE